MGGYLDEVACALNAQQIGDEQVLHMAHHEMVHRGSMCGVPLLGQRGVTFLDLIAIARYVIVVQHFVKQLALVVLHQRVEQVTITYIACGQTVAMSMNIF